jgi:hypothetical protein
MLNDQIGDVMQRNEFRFADKPGVTPGRPLTMGTINDVKHIARIESRHLGVPLNCQRLKMPDARLAVAYCEHADTRSARLEQRRGVRIHLGGAF